MVAKKKCTKGNKKCGKSCIPAENKCHKTRRKTSKKCKKGAKKCGKTCITKKKTCHKSRKTSKKGRRKTRKSKVCRVKSLKNCDPCVGFGLTPDSCNKELESLKKHLCKLQRKASDRMLSSDGQSDEAKLRAKKVYSDRCDRTLQEIKMDIDDACKRRKTAEEPGIKNLTDYERTCLKYHYDLEIMKLKQALKVAQHNHTQYMSLFKEAQDVMKSYAAASMYKEAEMAKHFVMKLKKIMYGGSQINRHISEAVDRARSRSLSNNNQQDPEKEEIEYLNDELGKLLNSLQNNELKGECNA